MKQLLSLFLLLVPCLAWAQYPSNGNQKITLGEQTSADGLVFRGVASIDTVTATSKITRANKQDTSAFLLLDTVTNLLWHYKTASNGWSQAGGSTFDTTTLNLVSRFATKLNISDTASMLSPYIERGDTASMLTNYYRSGRTGIIQALDVPTLNQNTTGSAATLTTSRTFQTNLASTSTASFNGSANVTPGVTGTLPVANGGTGASSFSPNNYLIRTNSSGIFDTSAVYEVDGKFGIGFVPGAPTPLAKFHIVPTNSSEINSVLNGSALLVGSSNSVGWAFRQKGASNGISGIEYPFQMIVKGGLPWELYLADEQPMVFGTNVLERMRITGGGEIWMGYTTDQGNYRLQVKDSVYVGGNVSASAYTTRSDFNLKDDIFDLKYGLNDVLKLQPVEYTYKSNGSKQLGFIAQDIGTILPEVVSFEESMSVNYQAIIPILTKAIQEQQALIKALEQRIINLENK